MPLSNPYPPINDWYPVAWSRKLKQTAMPIFFRGSRIVLFRTEQKGIGALIDRCSHRHVPLSKGKIVQGCIQCPYHGWKFDPQGTCTQVPGLCEEKQNHSKRAINSYPAKEQDGLIWIYGNHEESPLNAPPRLPFYGEKGYTSFTMEARSKSTCLHAIENLLDPLHTHFVHNGLIRTDAVKRKKIEAIVRPGSTSVEVEYRNENQQSGLISKLFGANSLTGYGRFTLPSNAQLEYRDSKGTKLILTALFSPLDDQSVKAFITVTHRRHAWLPPTIHSGMLKILFHIGMKQDINILEMQSQNMEHFGHANFVCTEIDLIFPHVQRLMKDAIEGTIDPSKKYPEKEVSLWL